MKTYRIKPGCGYWDCTKYPLGGCFYRAGVNGLEFTAETEFRWNGRPMYRGTAAGGVRLAVGIEHCEPIEEKA